MISRFLSSIFGPRTPTPAVESYRTPAAVTADTLPRPPSCSCWLGAENKAALNAVGSWFHEPACEDYRRRYPETVVHKRNGHWTWSSDAQRLYYELPEA